ncbi:hypothetical protein B0O99DRAFT_662448 [Bisporella sp. PMI_857]|nr:hypothetical protein B0O99DRAFT_662448 [Bisporella sp. PMI_857]
MIPGDAIEVIEGSSSSGSSTLEGTTCSLAKSNNEDENSALLGNRRPFRVPVLSYIRAFLMYQPHPIPFFNKALPSNEITIVISAFILLNIFYTFFRINFVIDELAVLAHRSGLVFVANLPLLYLLAAKNQPLKVLSGSSYESFNVLHRRLGEILCLEAVLHTVAMLGVWYTILFPLGFELSRFLMLNIVFFGIGAFLCYEIIYITSLASFRQRWYELSLGLHVILQTAGLGFLYYHHRGLSSRIYLQVALAIFSLKYQATVNVMKVGATVALSMTISRRSKSYWKQVFGYSIMNDWQATDHVFLSVPSLSRKHFIQAHPFTIASPAPASDKQHMHLQLLIRSLDGFSLDLLKKSKQLQQSAHPYLNVRIDGPYGSSHARNFLASSDLAILVAGGSGIAVVWPLLHHLISISFSGDPEIIPTRMLKRQQIVLIWVVHKEEHKDWISKQNLQDVQNMGIRVVIPGATEDFGRPDLRSMMNNTIREYFPGKKDRRKKARVVASGPDSMGRQVRNTCSGLTMEGHNVDVAIEKFGW